MYGLKLVAVIAFIAVSVKGCELSEEMGQKVGMECMLKHASTKFRKAIFDHMTNSEEPPTFICNYQPELVNIVLCIKDELQECMPQEYKSLMELFPSKERLAEGFQFMCSHKTVLEDQCMDSNMQSFMQCYMGKMQTLRSSFTKTDLSADYLKGLLCRVVRSEEQCFRENKGSCTKAFVDVVIETLETFFPMTSCPVAAKQALANTVLGSILIHGAPQNGLKFEPRQYKPYVIKN